MTSLSRTGSTNPLGKLTFEVKTRIPESVGDELSRSAAAIGVSVSEYLRDLIVVHVMGEDHVRRMYEERLAVLARKGTE
jgi:hypothetical protein